MVGNRMTRTVTASTRGSRGAAAPTCPHELWHTAASLAIASGASIKGVQSMLGHASAAMTLDRYGHLSDDELDAVAERMGAARADRGLQRGRPLVSALSGSAR